MIAPGQRIATIDVVRGVAVLGILAMNIVNFAMPRAAYMNPRAYGGWEGVDLAAWAIDFVLVDGKMRGLFSLLFGASMLLVIDRAEARGENPATIHYSRMAWLLAFGLAHLFLVWDGDILAHYALVGMIAFLCREMPVHRLVGMALVLLLIDLTIFGTLPFAVAALQDARSAEDLRMLAEFRRSFGIPTVAEIAQELARYRGGYAALVEHRVAEQAMAPVNSFFLYGPETLAYILMGMAALRGGLLDGSWPRARYLRWALVCFGIGIPAGAAVAGYMIWRGFDMQAVVIGAMALSTPIRPVMILGWACLIVLLARPGGALTARLAAAGRMAFTNYLATSLICTTLFYGYGLGWFGHLSRAQLWLVVLAVWAAILLWSKPWLGRFAYGPMEWLWRSLARRNAQPIFIANAPQ